VLTDSAEQLVARLLDVIDQEIVPLTGEAVRSGNKIFGAAILKKADSSLVVAGTNHELDSPLWHGEISAIKNLYSLPVEHRPQPKDCVFLSTHEPCSLCLSAITWAGFDNFYYLFTHQDSRDSFDIPHDLRILDEVFGCPQGSYNRSNAYWESHAISEVLDRCETTD
jgi:tRNA(Arg) A34 adenosine deaminase TadA